MGNKNIEDFLEQFTIPLFFRGNNRDIQDKNGTGVLVQINNQFFIFTAGHCVDIWSATEEDDNLIILLDRDQIVIKIDFSGFCYESGKKDFGVFKLNPEDVDIITRYGKSFLPEQQLILSEPEMEESVLISGYPLACSEGALMLHVVFKGTVLPTQDPRCLESYKVWVSKEQLEQVSNLYDPWVEANSQGISGGGCWVIRDITSNEEVTSAVYLIGIHFLADTRNSAGHEKYEAKLSNHIKLLENMRVSD